MSLETLTLSPEFAAATPEMLESCVAVGGAVVRNFLSEESAAQLQERHAIDFGMFMNSTPETRELLATIQEINLNRINGVVESLDIAAPDPEKNVPVGSHIDTTTPYATVLTMLCPLAGDPAKFGADVNEFNFTNESSRQPAFLTYYGVRDAVFVRQQINVLNGEPVSLRPAQHVGLSHTRRRLVAVDFMHPDNALWTRPNPGS